jgi:hypothetical protein
VSPRAQTPEAEALLQQRKTIRAAMDVTAAHMYGAGGELPVRMINAMVKTLAAGASLGTTSVATKALVTAFQSLADFLAAVETGQRADKAILALEPAAESIKAMSPRRYSELIDLVRRGAEAIVRLQTAERTGDIRVQLEQIDDFASDATKELAGRSLRYLGRGMGEQLLELVYEAIRDVGEGAELLGDYYSAQEAHARLIRLLGENTQQLARLGIRPQDALAFSGPLAPPSPQASQAAKPQPTGPIVQRTTPTVVPRECDIEDRLVAGLRYNLSKALASAEYARSSRMDEAFSEWTRLAEGYRNELPAAEAKLQRCIAENSGRK